MGKWLDRVIERKESKDNIFGDMPRSSTDKTDKMLTTAETTEGDGRLDFIGHLTETEREYYLDLLEIMESPKFGMDRETAEREAGRIIARNRQPLQIQQAARDYLKYGYVKIFSTVLDGVVYLARDQGAAKRVPDLNTPVYLESDIEAVKGLDPEVARIILETKMLLGGVIKVEEYTEPPSKGNMDGKRIARNFYGEKQRVERHKQ